MEQNPSEKKQRHRTPKPKQTNALVRFMFGGWITAFNDIYQGIVVPFQQTETRLKTMLTFVISLVVTWFIYVPFHELLHVVGCRITGGTVSTLVMGREYGAAFLSRIFPFIVPASGQYAGRLTDFKPNGDIGYLVTVFAPYLLTLFPGVWCITTAISRRSFTLFGPGIVIGLASFYNLTGDFFEIGTIISTRLVNLVTTGKASSIIDAFWELRSDDLFRLITEISSSPASFGANHPTGLPIMIIVIVLGLILAVCSAGYTYFVGRWIAGLLTTHRPSNPNQSKLMHGIETDDQ